MSKHPLWRPGLLRYLVDRPVQGLAQALPQHSSTGLADGRQLLQSPFRDVAFLQLDHQQTVRQHDHVHVPGLALAVAKLTVSHAKLLLAVPMECLRSCPPLAVNLHYPIHFPIHPIAYQNLSRLLVSLLVPQNHDTDSVLDSRNPQRATEVPLTLVFLADLLAITRRNRRGQLIGPENLPFVLDVAVEFQITYIATNPTAIILFAGDVVEDLRIGEKAVEDEVPWDALLANPIHQLAKQDRVVLESNLIGFGLFSFFEASKLQGVMFAIWANVVSEQVVMSDLIALLGMIPKPADILDQLAVVVDEDVVQSEDATRLVASGGIFLEQLQTSLVEGVDIPIDLGEEFVEARLIGGLGELVVNAENGFSFGQEESGKVFGEMLSLRLATKQVGEVLLSLFDELRECNDTWHGSAPCGLSAPSKSIAISSESPYFNRAI